MPIGGVAILIHEDLEHHIVRIRRENRRITTVTLHSEGAHAPITIINTYSPHQGKTKVEQEDVGKSTGNNTHHTQKTHGNMVCRRKWANMQN